MMILEDIMIKDVLTLREEDSIQSAIELMREQKIRHLPIVDDEHRLMGLVSNQDLRDATPSIFRSDFHLEDLQHPLSKIMNTDVVTGHPLDFVEDVAAVFYECKIGCMPVLLDHKLVGIVTETDMLHTLVKLTGANKPGSHIQLRVEDKSGVLHDVLSVFKERKANIHSLLVYPDPSGEAYKILAFRIQTMNPNAVVSKLSSAGFEVVWPQVTEQRHE